MSAEDVHHRLVLAIETSSTSSSAFSAFKEIALDRLTTQLALVSFEVAILTFTAINGTARSCQSCSPWTTDISTLSGWLDAIPSLMEGIGYVAAFEALAEAISMLELPSAFTPAAQTPMLHEIMMFWLSDASPAQSNLIASPDQQIHNQFHTFKLPLLLLQHPNTALLLFTQSLQQGSRKVIIRVEKEYAQANATQPGGQHQEELFTLQACSILPDLVACLLKSSSQISVVWKTFQAIHQHVTNDPVFQQQRKAFTQHARAGNAAAKPPSNAPHGTEATRPKAVAPAKVKTPNTPPTKPPAGTPPQASPVSHAAAAAHASASTGSHPPPKPAVPAAATRPAGPAGHAAAAARAPMRPEVLQHQARAQPGKPAAITQAAKHNTAKPIRLATSDTKAACMWRGSIGVTKQYGAQEVIARNVELLLQSGDFLSQAVPPSKWPPVLEMIGIIPTKVAHPETVAPDRFCRMYVKLTDEAVQNLFLKYSANTCFFSWPGSLFTIAVFSKVSLHGRTGMFLREATRARCFPSMQPPPA
eukprot:jgi/Ulvmu1/10396/UM061_0080.1